jgi:hypothetical protein
LREWDGVGVGKIDRMVVEKRKGEPWGSSGQERERDAEPPS